MPYPFPLSGRVAEEDSRFTYIAAQNWAFFNDLDYEPVYEPNVTDTDSGITDDDVTAVCGENSDACAFDYIVTEDAAFAASTLEQEDVLIASAAAAAPGKTRVHTVCGDPQGYPADSCAVREITPMCMVTLLACVFRVCDVQMGIFRFHFQQAPPPFST